MRWEFKMADVTEGGILTTASDLLFSGGREGYFFALDARNGELLWKAAVGAAVQSRPMTYSVNGKQYVAAKGGTLLVGFCLWQLSGVEVLTCKVIQSVYKKLRSSSA